MTATTLFDVSAAGVALVTPEHVRERTLAGLLRWLEFAREEVLAASTAHGAVLFRGFGVLTPAAFERLAEAVDPGVEPYAGGATDRAAVGDKVYEASRYPAGHHLPIHSETCYLHRYPRRLFFACPVVATRGGETTLADNRAILAQIPDRVALRLRRDGVQYVRNVFSQDSGLRFRIARAVGSSAVQSWQEMFATESQADVEAHCQRAGMAFRWLDDGRLCLNDVVPAVRRHPVTGEEVWFNQAHIFHVGRGRFGALTPLVRLLNGAGEDALFGANYGDGAPIADDDMQAIREVLRRNERPHAWEAGDVLVVDNLLLGHGRRPYRGERAVWYAQAMPPGTA